MVVLRLCSLPACNLQLNWRHRGGVEAVRESCLQRVGGFVVVLRLCGRAARSELEVECGQAARSESKALSWRC